MKKFLKDGGVKVLSPESSLIPLLLANGWIEEGAAVKTAAVDKAALLEKARGLGIQVHHATAADKIVKMIEEAEALAVKDEVV